VKVYLDDERKTPIGWERTYTVAETIGLLRTGYVTHLSLDHDLAVEHYSGDYSKSETGYDVLLWLEERVFHGFLPPPVIEVHSMNPAGKARMLQAIERIKILCSKRYEAL